jgi:hypothetical protein
LAVLRAISSACALVCAGVPEASMPMTRRIEPVTVQTAM